VSQGKSDEIFTRKVSGILNSGFTKGRSTAAQAVNKVENRRRSANSCTVFSDLLSLLKPLKRYDIILSRASSTRGISRQRMLIRTQWTVCLGAALEGV